MSMAVPQCQLVATTNRANLEVADPPAVDRCPRILNTLSFHSIGPQRSAEFPH